MKNKRIKFLLLSLILTFNLTVLGQSKPDLTGLSLLEGKVTNPEGIPIPDARITLESFEGIIETTTGVYGEFILGVEPSYYIIRIDRWSGKLNYGNRKSYLNTTECEPYFRPYRRSNIDLSSGEKTTLNIVLIESGCVRWSDEKVVGGFLIRSHGLISSRVEYETLSDDLIVSNSPKLVIQYGDREKKGNDVVYTMNAGRQTDYPTVILTYDRMTIYADKIIVNNKKKNISTAGKVIVENGKERLYAKRILVNMKSKSPTFAIEK